MRQSPGVDRRTEQWRREVGHELSSLRGHISRAVLLGNPEERCLCNGPREIPTAILDSLMTEPTPFFNVTYIWGQWYQQICFFLDSFGSKLCREEIENLQREVDSLKTRLSERQSQLKDHHALNLCCNSQTSIVLFTLPASSFPHNRETWGGHISPADGDPETIWRQLQGSPAFPHGSDLHCCEQSQLRT